MRVFLKILLISTASVFWCAALGVSGFAAAQDIKPDVGGLRQEAETPDLTKATTEAVPKTGPKTGPKTALEPIVSIPTPVSASTAIPAAAILDTPAPTTIAPIVRAKVWPKLVLLAGPYARFLDYVHNAERNQPSSAEDLERMMNDLASIDGAKLSTAFRAHTILRAMQTPAFFEGVKGWGNTYDRPTIIRNLHINPAYVEQMPGYAQARTKVLRAIYEDGQTTQLAGSAYKDLAYSLQRIKWASKVGRGKALRLAALNNAHLAPRGTSERLLSQMMAAYAPKPRPKLATAPTPNLPPVTKVGPADNAALASLSSGADLLKSLVQGIGPNAAMAASADPIIPMVSATPIPMPAPDIAPPYSGLLQDILATAALHILDANAPYPSVLPPRNTPDTLAECVDWARLHLNQCVAATRYVYEDSFCIAQHQLKDAGQCIAAFVDGPASAPTH